MEEHISVIYHKDESRFPANISSITTIPKNVTSIGDYAFSNYRQLTNIAIPPSVTLINDLAFYNCKSLTNIVIPPSVTSICVGAFERCASLTNIVIPPSVRLIDYRAFGKCTSLTSILIPPSVTSIGHGAFFGCTSLTHIIIPPSVISIGKDIFKSCTSLSFIDVTLPLALEECPEPNLLSEAIRSMALHNMEKWVKTRRKDGRLPLCSAAAASLKWKDIKRIFEANMVAIYERDEVTALSPFMLAAVGTNSDLETVYRLCREYPNAIIL